jgi:hypothetical protein
MIDLFTPDDRAVLAESFGREPDDTLLAKLLDTAREIARTEYHDDLSRYASRLEIYRNRLAQYEHDFAAWSVAAQDFSRQSRRYEGALSVWRSAASREDMPEPPAPVDPGPMPERPEAPVEPTVPTDASAVALLMAEQRAAVARARLEPKPAPASNWRQEIEDTIAYLMSPADPVPEPATEPPPQLLPEPDASDEQIPLPLLPPISPKDAEAIIEGFTSELRTGRDVVESTMRSMETPDRKRLFSLLNTELGRLKNQEALLGKSIPRRADVEELIGILAKVGEA